MSIGLASLENFEIKSVKCFCLILSTELIERKFRSFAITPERAFLIIINILSVRAFLKVFASF